MRLKLFMAPLDVASDFCRALPEVDLDFVGLG